MSTEVLLCDSMWTNLIVKTADGDVEARSERALVKIEETHDGLKIYVPSDEAGLLSCSQIELPTVLASLLGIGDAGANKQIYRILNDETRPLSVIMKDEDIPRVQWLYEPPEAQREQSSHNGVLPSSPSLIREQRSASPSGSESSRQLDSPPSSPPPAYPDEKLEPGQLLSHRPQFYSHFQGGIIQRVVQKNLYRDFLQKVVEQAQRPSSNGQGIASETADAGTFSMSTLAAALADLEPTRLDQRFRGNEPLAFAETSKLGAAGELFVSCSFSQMLRVHRT